MARDNKALFTKVDSGGGLISPSSVRHEDLPGMLEPLPGGRPLKLQCLVNPGLLLTSRLFL